MSMIATIIAGLAALTAVGSPHVCEAPRTAVNAALTAAERCAHVDIDAGGKIFSYTDKPLIPSDFTVAEEIEKRRINAPLSVKMETVDEYLKNGADYRTALGVCFPLLENTVDAAAEYVYRAPVDSTVEYGGGRFSATPDSPGVRLDYDRVYAGIYYCFKYGVTDSIKAGTTVIAPIRTKKEVESGLTLRAEYTTDFSSSPANRAHNVALALSKLDGAVILPGESLSFNAAVGKRTEENGFRTAKIIVDGSYVDGVGGGACQASTALYNAALIAGLKCRANAHSICPSYCPPGLDAMISDSSDLCIFNPTESSVYVSCRASGGKGRVRVYGLKNEYEIRPESEVVKTIDFETVETVDTEKKYFAQAESGDRMLVAPGRTGYESATYLSYYKNGVLIKRARIRTNAYIPKPQIIAVAP